MSHISELLFKQITSAEAIIKKADTVPDGKRCERVAGFIKYDEKYTRPLSTEADGWEKDTKEILMLLYGENARQVIDFQNCTREKHLYYKFREELKEELKTCIAFLRTLIKTDAIKQELQMQSTNQVLKKPPMVFVSHSSKDKPFVEALVNLLEDLGMSSKNVFCSSINGYGIKLGQDIFDELKGLFERYELFVIFIHSPRYYDSAISLNEMGAAWALKTGFCSFLTVDMDFEDMVGVINKETLSLKVDNDDAPARLTELKDKLVKLFNLPPIDEIKWERKRNLFLNTVCNITHKTYKKAIDVDHGERAIIRTYSVKAKGGQRILSIKNEGNSVAFNLHVSIPNNDYWASRPNLPVTFDELPPGAERTITLALVEGQNEATLYYTWDDESQKDNSLKQTIDL